MRISVVVPSYRRPAELDRCLAALRRQERPADELIVVLRDSDELSATHAELSEVIVTRVTEPGVLAAMIVGAERSTGDLIAFTDDDAAPHPDWLARIEQALSADASAAGIGGRDQLFDPDGSQRATTLTHSVGQLSPVGRMTGNHHRGQGGLRRVDVLKGVNAAYRRADLALPLGLRGQGAQVHFEVALGCHVSRSGRHLLYDPAILVDHHPASRLDADARDDSPPDAVADAAFNLTAAISVLGPLRLLLRLAYALVVGDLAQPGLLRALLALLSGDRRSLRRLGPSLRGNLAAAGWWLRGGRLSFVSPPPR